MIHVVATIKIKKGKRDEFIEHLRANVPNVIGEKGCLEYSPAYEIDFKNTKLLALYKVKKKVFLP